MRVLVALLLLLTLTTAAYAECAWVLWFNVDRTGGQTWELFAAYETHNSCMSNLAWAKAARGETEPEQPRPFQLLPRHHRPTWAEGEVDGAHCRSVTYREALLSTFKERPLGARILSVAGAVTLPVLPLLSWLLALSTELQTILWAVFVIAAWGAGLDAGRVVWKRTWAALEEERRYKSALGTDLEALGQRLYKRTTEWWAAALAHDRATADMKRAEAEAVMHEINEKLRTEVSEPDAGYFRRPRPYEPFRPSMALLPDGNWINEMWYRVARLEEIIERIRYGPARRS